MSVTARKISGKMKLATTKIVVAFDMQEVIRVIVVLFLLVVHR